MSYQPYPIYDYKSGKVTAKEPWLIPIDAFETLKNGHLKDGVLEKRSGYTEFGQLVSVDTSTKVPTLSTNPIMGIITHTSNTDIDTLLIMDQDRINKYESSISTGITITAFADAGGGEVTVTAASHGFSTDDIVTISGTTNYNGTFSITKVNDNQFKITDTWVSDDATGTASQEQFVDLTRNKLRYKGKTGQNWTPSASDVVKGANSGATGTVKSNIVDTGSIADDDAAGTIVFTNGSVSGTFTDGEELQEDGTPANIAGQADGANTDDEFTGDNTNFFWAVNWKGTLYLTNNNDVIQKYDGTDLSRLHIDLDTEGGPDNDITTAKFIVLYKSRLVIFTITERGVYYPNRARWCDVNDPDTWADLSYLDCPQQGVIQSMAFLGQDLYVFFKKRTFRFAYTGDEDLPFVWQKVDSFEGSYAQMSSVEYPDEILTVGKTNIVGLDGNRTYHVDLANPNFVPTWTQDSLPYSHGRIWKNEDQGWITYASLEATANADGNIYPDSVLVLNIDEKNWSTYKLPIHCMGLTDLEAGLTWNDVTDAWEDIDWSWLDSLIQSGGDVRLFGSQDGKVYKLDQSLSDNGSAIEYEVVSGRWNPYWKQGYNAVFGWLDFLVDVDDNASFSIYFYKDQSDTSWLTGTVDCSGSGSKQWIRVPVFGESAEFHRIKIYNNATNNRPRIHACIPYFRRGGRLF